MHFWYRISGSEAPKRDPKWKKARKDWIKGHPECAACGGRLFLQVHHKVPFHVNKKLELDPTNFITLCELPGRNHHFKIGHLGDWRKSNANVEQDAELERKLYPTTASLLARYIRWR